MAGLRGRAAVLSGASLRVNARIAQEEFRLATIAADVVPKRRYQHAVAAAILILVGVRLVCAALVPLSFDESDYWIWSKHIAGGYFDHPPINPILIRIGTTLFGDTEFGVRVLGVLLHCRRAGRSGDRPRSCSMMKGSAPPRLSIST